MIATEVALEARFAFVNVVAPYHLSLDLHEVFTRDDGFVAVFDIILRHDAVILNELLCKEVYSCISHF